MSDNDMRQTNSNPCTLGVQTGPQTIIVRQVIGEQEAQKVLDIHVRVPPAKPAIEQIVDVFVKDVEINTVDVITDKVIVRGEFEIKAIYVACLPDQPVHAVEIKSYKWSQDIPIPGARKGMDADASVTVEFVDYDINEYTRAYKYKYEDACDDPCDDDAYEYHQHHHHHHHDECEEEAAEEEECTREFDVSVVLKIVAKVLTDREVQIGTAGIGTTPKG